MNIHVNDDTIANANNGTANANNSNSLLLHEEQIRNYAGVTPRTPPTMQVFTLFYYTLILSSVLLALAGVISQATLAQDVLGCCCDPLTRTGDFQLQQSCPPGYLFRTNIALGTSCNTLCGTILSQPAVGPCSENGSIRLQNILASPVAGQKAIRLQWDVSCPVNAIQIKRCTGAECTRFDVIDTIPQASSYIDTSPELLFGEQYTYIVTGKQSASEPTGTSLTITQTPGELECLGQQQDTVFCLSLGYYAQFQQYLEQFGYKNPDGTLPATERRAFLQDFSSAVQQLFVPRLNKAFTCDSENRVHETWSCPSTQSCVSDNTVRCAQTSSCATPPIGQTNLFGLLPGILSCEGTATARKYCFIDKTATTANTCYTCDSRMSCYDYKSKNACQKDNCGVGIKSTTRQGCQWRDLLPELGTGVCVDPQRNNCLLCDSKGTPTVQNLPAYNNIFDQCSDAKARAIGRTSDAFPCFFDSDTHTARSCEAATCELFRSQDQCGSPIGGIALGPANQLLRQSNDACGLHVCEFISTPDGGGFCVKNADGNILRSDCSPGNLSCQQDHYPPTTSLLPFGALGRTEGLLVHVTDKTSPLTPAVTVASYKTFFCVQNSTTSCNDARTFTLSTQAQTLLVSNGKLMAGQLVLGTLPEGTVTLFFFSKDPSSNVEQLRNITINVCSNCTPPILVGISITSGQVLNTTLFTRSSQPVISISFAEPASILTAQVTIASGQQTALALSPPSGFFANITLSSPNLFEGAYPLKINTIGQNGIPRMFDFKLVIDTTTPTLILQPSTGTVFNTAQVKINISASEQVVLQNVTLEEDRFVNEFVKTTKTSLLLNTSDTSHSVLQTTNNKFWSGQFTFTSDGTKRILARAEDLAGNSITATSSIIIGVNLPSIRMASPTFGVSTTPTFPVVIETSTLAVCKYWFDAPTPDTSQFNSLLAFDSSTGTTHTKQFSLPFGSTTEHQLAVMCKNDAGIAIQDFKISVDPFAPIIQVAQAFPNPIIEGPPFQTTLQVQTNTPGFCKYSSIIIPYAQMNEFPEYQLVASRSHVTNISVAQTGAAIRVICESRAGIIGQAVTIPITVNTQVPLTIISNTPLFSQSTTPTLALQTNKNAACFFGTSTTSISTQFSTGFSLSHTQLVTATPGVNTYFVRCVAASSGETTPVLTITILVDSTPPTMIFVDDTQTVSLTNKSFLVPEEPHQSFLTDKLRVSFLAGDNESGVTSFIYKLVTGTGDVAVIKDTIVSNTNGTPFYVTKDHNNRPLNLTDGATYRFLVKPVNGVNLTGQEVGSTGVTIDISKKPEFCKNGIKDVGEVDIDCGGSCGPCDSGKKCDKSSDCTQNSCTNKICTKPLCTDVILNGDETDVDCGGNCGACSQGKTCLLDKDCVTGLCNSAKRCVVRDSCSDGSISGAETDIDCGGSCPTKCSADKRCSITTDCATGLSCISTSCKQSSSFQDQDGDEIPDTTDRCPNTPPGSRVDSFGCTRDQTPTGGDTDETPASCSDGQRGGSETDVDCGGSCPTCNEKKSCAVHTDCASGLRCVGLACTPCVGCTDEDHDGIFDVDDKCPGTPQGTLIDSTGCGRDTESPFGSKSSCGDSITDAWRIHYFGTVTCDGDAAPESDPDKDKLTNLEEFRSGTSPLKPDTDEDEFTDATEVDKGTNPANPLDHPGNGFWFWFLIIILICALGVGGWFGWKKYGTTIKKAFNKKTTTSATSSPHSLLTHFASAKKTTASTSHSTAVHPSYRHHARRRRIW